MKSESMSKSRSEPKSGSAVRGLRGPSLVLLLWGVGLGLAACGDDTPRPAPARAGPAVETQGPAPTPPSRSPAPSASPSAPPGAASAQAPGPEGEAVASDAVERWYEMFESGQKLGFIRVVWAPSTWEGRPSVRDTTTTSTVSVRDMMGTEEENQVETTAEVERDAHGTLHWMRSVSVQDGRRSSGVEVTWTGAGYVATTTVSGSSQRVEVAAATPAHVDPEAFLHERVARGELRVGDRLVCRQLDVAARTVVEMPVEVVGAEPGPGPKGDVPCLKVKVTDPSTGSESWWWLDAEGAVARYRVLSTDIRRVSAETARRRPASPHTYSITTPSAPPLERVFTANRCLVDVHVRPDPDRPLPEPPASPFSRVLAVEPDARGGHVLRVECLAYPAPADVRATLPVAGEAFAPDLEATALMPIAHPTVVRAARRAIGDATDAKVAVERIGDFVFGLRKESAVGEANAVEILETMRGDCSEHATLFVALCRAVGVPARKCSGFVNVGEAWGSHAWAEVWVGAWMGVDPTTNDVGTAARYVFFGYADRPDAKAGVVAARAQGRLRFVTTRVEEGDDLVDLAGPETWTSVDETARRARHHLLGLEARGWPEGWKVVATASRGLRLSTPKGSVTVTASADQGLRGDVFLRRFRVASSFCGQPASVSMRGTTTRVTVSSRRRLVEVVYEAPRGGAADFAALRPVLERVLAPTFTHVPKAP